MPESCPLKLEGSCTAPLFPTVSSCLYSLHISRYPQMLSQIRKLSSELDMAHLESPQHSSITDGGHAGPEVSPDPDTNLEHHHHYYHHHHHHHHQHHHSDFDDLSRDDSTDPSPPVTTANAGALAAPPSHGSIVTQSRREAQRRHEATGSGTRDILLRVLQFIVIALVIYLIMTYSHMM